MKKDYWSWVLFGIIIILILYPLGYWGFNSHLTEMQIFLKFWWLYLIVVGIRIVLFKYFKI
jgi:hypothetical protein